MVSPSVLKMAIDTMQKQKKTNSVPTKEETELKKTVVEGSQIHCLREIQLFGDKKKINLYFMFHCCTADAIQY